MTAACLLGAAALSACTEMPVAGPTISQVEDPESVQANTYVVIDLTPSIVRKLQSLAPKPLSASFGGIEAAAPQRLGCGDTVSVTIWESGAGGLFFAQPPPAAPAAGGAATPSAPAGARSITLPNQVIDLRGEVTVPYAGQVAVAGLTTTEAQALIGRQLEHKALEPQVMVSVVQNQSNIVTVSGDVAQPGRLPLYLQGSRILDVIAQAGGSKWPAYDTTVQLTRAGVSRRIAMAELLADPSENIMLQTGDMVHLIRQPQTVAVLGAVTTNSLVPFDTERLTLAEALAKAGGLNDNQANARGVFVFRFEPAAVVRELVPPTSQVQLPEITPVVFRANLQEGGALFLTESFGMSDKDVVYIADTQSVQLSKLLGLLRNTALIFQSRGAFVTN